MKTRAGSSPRWSDPWRTERPFQASSGEQVRDYLHVEDVARAFISLATTEMGRRLQYLFRPAGEHARLNGDDR